MKSLLFFITAVILSGSSCKKHKPISPVDQLPPETQTGANTFGCLVNGQVFKPGGAQLIGGSLQCNYQFVNGGYYFVLIGRNKKSSNYLSSVGIYTDSLTIHVDDKLNLKKRINGNPSADFFKAINASQYKQYETNGVEYSGELWIKHMDIATQIISGTFWFDAVDTVTGEKVEVREGRFDLHYTQ